MPVAKNNLCVFVHYSRANSVPRYVRLYVNELSHYFDEVKVLTNNHELSLGTSFNGNVSMWHTINQGYDFGMFFRFSESTNLNDYSQVAIINDSNLLLNKLAPVFNWGNSNDVDFWGIIDSHEKPWFSQRKDAFHIQSHFLVFNKKAIEKLPSFFESMNLEEIMNETDQKKLRRLVIDQWEIGLSQFLLAEGLQCASFIDSKSFLSSHKTKKKNATHELYNELIAAGYPLLKKKIALKKTLHGLIGKTDPLLKFLLRYSNTDWDIEEALLEIRKRNSFPA